MNRHRLLSRLVVAFTCAALLSSVDLPVAQSQEKPKAAEGDGRIKFLNGLADEHTLEAKSGDEFAISKESVLNYSNPGQSVGTFVGTTKLWLDRQRPVAVCCFSMRVPDERVYYEMVSLVDEEMRCSRDGNTIWIPATTDSKVNLLKEVAASPNPNRRLTQMRSIARQFEAHGIDRDPTQKNPFRLLPQPIYRYKDTETGIIDGAIFAFAVLNDPELLLQLEVVTDASGGLVWQYKFARMTSWRVAVSRKGEQVWTVPNFYESGGRRPNRSYFENRLGYFVDGEMRTSPK